MRYFIAICLFILFCDITLHAQTDLVEESITYKDGSVFKGVTIEKGETSIKYKLSSVGDTITLQRAMINKWFNRENHFIYNKGKYHSKAGKFKSINLSIGGNAYDGTMRASFVLGKLINPRLGVGGGLGFNLSTASMISWHDYTYLELFGYGRKYLNDNKRRLFIDGKLGIALPLANNQWQRYSAGPFLDPSIGWEFASTRRLRWSVRFSQFLMYSTISHDNNLFFSDINEGNDNRYRENFRVLYNRSSLGINLNF